MTQLRDQLQASLGDAYVIERELNGAGMSRVFTAEDASLGRRVVVKVLPEDLSGAVSIARFRREIAVAARLQHPHIVPVLAAGEVDGLPYYTMPFVEGESLGEVLAREKLSFPQTISILRDVARALEFAHRKGIAHRDIKPANVLIAGTSAVITDFGVAKALSDSATSGELTSVGVALGTPAYMAPEQAAADPNVDARADIYAFGSMAYEMIAGHPPFAGRSPQSMIAAQVTESPQPVSAVRADTPPGLATLVMRCLEKNPADRPQNATEILQVLDGVVTGEAYSSPKAPARNSQRLFVMGGATVALVVLVAVGFWWRGRSAGADIHSIAVLPFENTSGDSTFEYLEDGITDHVRDALNNVPQLTVKARSSSQQMKGHSAREIGTKLGVDAVLEGTVSRSRSRLHVTAELVRAADDIAMWSSTFDVDAKELTGLQDTIVRSVLHKLYPAAAEPVGSVARAQASRGTDDIDAFDDFLRGRHAYDQIDFATAVTLFRRAIQRDPRFARAHAYLAQSYASLPVIGIGPTDSLLALAEASATRALALDSTVAEAYVAQSYILDAEFRLGDAVKPLEKAYAIDSTKADVDIAYALALTQTGDLNGALRLARRARDEDPRSAPVVGIGAYVRYLLRQYDAAIADGKAGLDLDPKSVLGYQSLGFFYAFAGMPDSAWVMFTTAFKLNPSIFGNRSNLVFADALTGRWSDAARERAALESERPGNSRSYHRMVADLAFGQYNAAIAELERGVSAGEPLLQIISIPCDPLFDPLKSDPRFESLMRRIGAKTCPATGVWPIKPRVH